MPKTKIQKMREALAETVAQNSFDSSKADSKPALFDKSQESQLVAELETVLGLNNGRERVHLAKSGLEKAIALVSGRHSHDELQPNAPAIVQFSKGLLAKLATVKADPVPRRPSHEQNQEDDRPRPFGEGQSQTRTFTERAAREPRTR